jgi:hypothetical protein
MDIQKSRNCGNTIVCTPALDFFADGKRLVIYVVVTLEYHNAILSRTSTKKERKKSLTRGYLKDIG